MGGGRSLFTCSEAGSYQPLGKPSLRNGLYKTRVYKLHQELCHVNYGKCNRKVFLFVCFIYLHVVVSYSYFLYFIFRDILSMYDSYGVRFSSFNGYCYVH